MGKIQENDARLQQLVSMARIGWWEVDFDEGVYYCSEFVADLLGIEGYLQPIITQYFIDNKSEIWLLFLIAHSKR